MPQQFSHHYQKSDNVNKAKFLTSLSHTANFILILLRALLFFSNNEADRLSQFDHYGTYPSISFFKLALATGVSDREQ
jgi:hypothetical protein